MNKKNKYEDHEFVPDVQSLLDYDYNGGLFEESVEFFKTIVFKRASDVYPGLC